MPYVFSIAEISCCDVQIVLFGHYSVYGWVDFPHRGIIEGAGFTCEVLVTSRGPLIDGEHIFPYRGLCVRRSEIIDQHLGSLPNATLVSNDPNVVGPSREERLAAIEELNFDARIQAIREQYELDFGDGKDADNP